MNGIVQFDLSGDGTVSTNNPRLSRRAAAIQPSPTLQIYARANELKAQGVDIINLGAGEPDYPVPLHVKEAAVAAVHDDLSHYTAVNGTPELRAAIARKLARENDLTYSPDQILVTVGGKHALYNAFMALIDPGDEVIIPAPYWVSYPEQVRLAEGEPVFVDTVAADGFCLDPDRVTAAITPRTRGLIINSPNNPTGAVYNPEDLAALAQVARDHDLWVITDEIYERLVYDGQRQVSIAGFEGMAERTIIINGFSKAFAMTGWRLGYAAGPGAVIKAMANLQGHMTSNAASLVQAAGIVALDGPRGPIDAMVAEYASRRQLVLSRLADMPGITCPRPAGAFYVFPSVHALLGRRFGERVLHSAADFAVALLDEARVAVVPGEAFGCAGHIRLSYASSRVELTEALARIATALARIE